MLEEAAGVRMYESKKQNAIRIIEKRDPKVEEISKVFYMDFFYFLNLAL
jgi:chromosome segregation ATPase